MANTRQASRQEYDLLCFLFEELNLFELEGLADEWFEVNHCSLLSCNWEGADESVKRSVVDAGSRLLLAALTQLALLDHQNARSCRRKIADIMASFSRWQTAGEQR
jgi:hypothetical protein